MMDDDLTQNCPLWYNGLNKHFATRKFKITNLQEIKVMALDPKWIY